MVVEFSFACIRIPLASHMPLKMEGLHSGALKCSLETLFVDGNKRKIIYSDVVCIVPLLCI